LIWEAIVDRELADREIVDAVTALLSVAASEVVVVADVVSARVGKEVRVLCERQPLGGEFPLHLTLHLRDESLRAHHERQFFQGLSATLGCACLVSDGSPSPHSMLLLRSPGRVSQVWLDPDLLDEDQVVVLRGGTAGRPSRPSG
jgi:hypothetical protein